MKLYSSSRSCEYTIIQQQNYQDHVSLTIWCQKWDGAEEQERKRTREDHGHPDRIEEARRNKKKRRKEDGRHGSSDEASDRQLLPDEASGRQGSSDEASDRQMSTDEASNQRKQR